MKIKDFVVNAIEMFVKIFVRGLCRLEPHSEQVFGVIVQLNVEFVQTPNPIQDFFTEKAVVLRRLMLLEFNAKVKVERLLEHVLRDVLQFRQSEKCELVQVVLGALKDGPVPLFATYGRHVVALHHAKVRKHSVKQIRKMPTNVTKKLREFKEGAFIDLFLLSLFRSKTVVKILLVSKCRKNQLRIILV
jgi:hypothetical protein